MDSAAELIHSDGGLNLRSNQEGQVEILAQVATALQARSLGYCGWYSIALTNGLFHPLQKQMDHWWSMSLTTTKGVLFLLNLRQLLGSKISEHFENELGPIISAFSDPGTPIEDILLQPVF